MQIFGVALIINIVSSSERVIGLTNDGLFVGLLFVLTLLKVFPKLMTSLRTLHVVYGFLAAVGMLGVTIGNRKETLSLFSYTILLFRLLSSLTSINMKFVICCNVCHACLACSAYVMMQTACDLLSGYVVFIVAECMTSAYIVIVVYVVERACRGQIRKEMELQTARNESSSLTSLLNTMSDAVVELDADLRLVSDSPRFKCLLIHGGVGSMVGTQFSRFFSSNDDYDRFKALIATSSTASPSSSLAHVFHSRLRDSLMNTIHVEIFHVSNFHPSQGDRHLLGIRDSSDDTFTVPPLGNQMLATETQVQFAGGQISPSNLLPQTPRPAIRLQSESIKWPENHAGNTRSRHERRESRGTPRALNPTSVLQEGKHLAKEPSISSHTSLEDQSLDTSCGYMRTKHMAMEFSLIDVLMAWRVPDRNMCCPFHSALLDLRLATRRMGKIRCMENFGPDPAEWQCQKCGIVDESQMDTETKGCRICSCIWETGLERSGALSL